MTANPQPSPSRSSRLKQRLKLLSKGLSRRWYFAKRFAASCKQPAMVLLVVITMVLVLHIVSALAADTATLISWVRRTGLVLQIGGLLTVIWGIRKSVQLFGKPLAEAHVLRWLKGLWHVVMPPKPQHHFIEAEAGFFGFSGGRASSTVSGGTVEQRLKNLESDVDAAWVEILKLKSSGCFAANPRSGWHRFYLKSPGSAHRLFRIAAVASWQHVILSA